MSRIDSDFTINRKNNNQQAVVGTVVGDGKTAKVSKQGQEASFGRFFWFFKFIDMKTRRIVNATAEREENHVGCGITVTD